MKSALKNAILLNLLFAFSFPDVGLGQTLPTIFDGNDSEVGHIVSEPSLGSTEAVAVRPDGLIVHVDFLTGKLLMGMELYYENNSCTGPAYAISPDQNIAVFLVFGRSIKVTSETPYPVALVDPQVEVNDMHFSSKSTGSNQCTNLNLSSRGGLLEFVDPLDYGLVLTPSGEWGYQPPLVLKPQKSSLSGETIFCNSFENCPQQ